MVFGSLALLLLPYVLHDEFDDDCIEDDTRERCAVSLAVARIFYRTGVFDSCQRYRY